MFRPIPLLILSTLAGCVSPESRLANGDDLYLRGNYAGALRQYQMARRADPSLPDTRGPMATSASRSRQARTPEKTSRGGSGGATTSGTGSASGSGDDSQPGNQGSSASRHAAARAGTIERTAQMFRAAEVMLLSKVDLLPYLDFDVELCVDYARRVNPGIRTMQVSAKSGAGLAEWYDWLEAARRAAGAGQQPLPAAGE